MPPPLLVFTTNFSKSEGRGVAVFRNDPPPVFRECSGMELACCWCGELTKHLNKGSGEKNMLRSRRETAHSYGLGVSGASIITPVQCCHF